MVKVQAEVTSNQVGIQPQVRLLVTECEIGQRLVRYRGILAARKEKIGKEEP